MALVPAVAHAIQAPIDPIAAIYRAHCAMLVAYLFTVTRDRALAEDLAQEAFARLIVQARGPTSLPRDPAAWLVTVGRNLAVSHARHRRVGERVAARLPTPGPARSAEDVAIAQLAGRRAVAALDALDDDARTAVVMSAVGYSGLEASARLGRSPLATRALTCRARRRLRAATVRAG